MLRDRAGTFMSRVCQVRGADGGGGGGGSGQFNTVLSNEFYGTASGIGS